MSDIKDFCGIVGVYNHAEAANLAYLGLFALQHRGQESAGIVSYHEGKLKTERAAGKVAKIFTADCLERLTGNKAIGHVRYSTSGNNNLAEIQPLVVNYKNGTIAIAHNGNLVNAVQIREKLVEEGSIFQSTSDSEVIVHLIVKSKKKLFADCIIDALKQINGAYSLLFIKEDELIAVRDPYGFRPLCLGQLNDSSWVLSSETCALDLIGARFVREIEPGEMLVINNNEFSSIKPFTACFEKFCVFEYIYFSRPDSIFNNQNIHIVRKEFGRQLAKESFVNADIVISIPDSGTSAALGFSEVSGIPYDLGLIRNHYVGRTFIEPKQAIRNFGVKVKLNTVNDVLRGKRVVVVDDSLVRGTTSRKIVKMIRSAGATEVHMRIAAPPVKYPCFYGIDTPTKKELVASSCNLEEIREYITADSLAYLSMEGMYKAVRTKHRKGICCACFTGNYPLKSLRKGEN